MVTAIDAIKFKNSAIKDQIKQFEDDVIFTIGQDKIIIDSKELEAFIMEKEAERKRKEIEKEKISFNIDPDGIGIDILYKEHKYFIPSSFLRSLLKLSFNRSGNLMTLDVDDDKFEEIMMLLNDTK